MRTTMIIGLWMSAVLLGSLARGGEPAPAPPPAPSQPPPVLPTVKPEAHSPPNLPLGVEPFDFEFKGGTLKDLLSQLENQAAGRLNLLHTQDLIDNQEQVHMPPFLLRKITDYSTVLRAISKGIGRTSGFFVDFTPLQNGMDTVWIPRIELDPRLARSIAEADERVLEIYYVGGLLKKFKIEDLTTAITTAWKLKIEHPEANLKYHEDTKLLIVFGDRALNNIVTQVLGQLRQALEVEAPAKPPPPPAPAMAPVQPVAPSVPAGQKGIVPPTAPSYRPPSLPGQPNSPPLPPR
jgi:hypothetical protein